MSARPTSDMTRPSDPIETTPTTEESTCGCASRRQSLLAAGVVMVGAAGLSACGSGEAVGEAASSAVASASSAVSSAASAAGEAIATAEIPVGGGMVLEKLEVVVTQPTAGEYKAFSAVCTHQQCLVASVADGVIKCPCHGSEFDIATGAVTKGPATKALGEKALTVGADGITLS